MISKSVLLSGATGFLGSHVADVLVKNNYTVLALIRKNSMLWRLDEIKHENLVLVDLSTNDFKDKIQTYAPAFFIHAAWQGVKAIERNDWILQSDNVGFTLEMLSLANQLGIKKIVAFGSQAEYGNFHGRISETAICNPVNAYGAAKLATLTVLKSFCDAMNINWFWLRIFSVYGERENDDWLIPSVIKNILTDKVMDLTACEQKYDYIYAADFAFAILKVLETECDSGIFNLSSNSSATLFEMIEEIRKILNPKAILNFGALPYRNNQVMHMEGDSSKFYEKFNFNLTSGFEEKLKDLVNYYRIKSQKSKYN
jgi:UDP-glucose 4-epimerase